MANASKHQRINPFLNIIENLLILSLILSIYCSGINHVPYHGDEGDWIYSSFVYEPFISGNFSSSIWKETYWTLTQPNLPRYIIGISRTIGGFNNNELNLYRDWNKDDKTNIEEGRVPSDELLWWSRLPMTILASFSLFISFIILKRIAGRLTSYIWLMLGLFSSYFLIILRHSMGESTLLVCIAFTLLISYDLVISANKPEISKKILFLKFLGFGICVGLAGSSKLNGLSVLAAGLILSLIIAQRYINKNKKISFCVLSMLFIVLSSQITWVFLNPYLWSDPVNRTIKMFNHRVYEMNVQQEGSPTQTISGTNSRLKIITKRVFQDYAVIHFNGALMLNTLFFIIGFSIIVIKSLQFLINKYFNPAPIAFLLVSITTSFLPLLTPLDWDRYYLLPVYFSTMFVSIGIGWLALSGYDFVNRQINRIGIC